MWQRRFGRRAFVLVSAFALAQVAAGASPARAQNDTPGWNQPKPEASKPSARPRRRARRRARGPLPHVVARPLLTLQYRIFKIERNGTQIEVNPNTVFNAGDRVRFGLLASDDGYLTIIRQSRPDAPGRVLFPESRTNNVQNFVRRGQELLLPSVCRAGTPAFECSYPVNADSAQDFYTIIFSRDDTPDLPKDALQPDGQIRAQSLRQHWTTSGQRLSEAQQGATVFSLRVSNLNRRADGELTLRYVLNKRARTNASGSVNK
ncbi:MAG TPA: hypothetical protein VNA19_11735 [Pyrinomonadaceae bacterium]|jgi:hypothetical protein|nr:hypothetical protein [Pyrinomonadaceae bacterium]